MSKITNVLVTLHVEMTINDQQREMIKSAIPGARFTFCKHEEATDEMVRDAQVWFGNPSRGKLSKAENLQLLQLCTSGADYYLAKPEMLPKNLTITTATGTFGLVIAEYMIGSLIAIMRNMHIYRDQQRERVWNRMDQNRMIDGSTVLVVGLGDLGGEFARRVKSMGAYVIGLRRADLNKPDYVDELYLADELDNLLPRADVVALCLPQNAQTSGIIDKKRLSLLKKDSYLINVGRGNAVDTLALCKALDSGYLAGAVIDVTDPEPLPEDHPLWGQKNVILTPHSSGNLSTHHTINKLLEIAVQNLIRFDSGQPLINTVNPATGYRK